MSPQHVIKRDLKLSSSTADKRVKNRLYYENNDKEFKTLYILFVYQSKLKVIIKHDHSKIKNACIAAVM